MRRVSLNFFYLKIYTDVNKEELKTSNKHLLWYKDYEKLRTDCLYENLYVQ